jgi:hypothetical protein
MARIVARLEGAGGDEKATLLSIVALVAIGVDA